MKDLQKFIDETIKLRDAILVLSQDLKEHDYDPTYASMILVQTKVLLLLVQKEMENCSVD